MTAPVSLSPAQLVELRRAVSDWSAGVRARGERYLRDGRVLNVSCADGHIAAFVRGGTRSYLTQWFWEEGIWLAECECPVFEDCKHAFALAMYILGHAEPSFVGNAPPAPSTPTRAFAETLAGETNPWRRRDLVRRLLTLPPLSFQPYDELVMELLDVAEKEQDSEVACWMLAGSISQSTDGRLPAELQPYLDRGDLQQRYAQRERSKLTTAILTWVTRRKVPSRRALSFRWSLRPNAGTGVALFVDVRLTTSRMQDEPRSLEQLRQLLGEAQRSPGTLSDEHLCLLTTYLSTSGYGGFSSRSGSIASSPATAVAMWKAIDGESPAMIWDAGSDPGAVGRGGIQPGTRLRFERQPLRVLPATLVHDTGARLELMCLWPDGSQRRLSDVLYFPGNPDYRMSGHVIWEGSFFQVSEEPPVHLRDRFLQLGGLDIPREQCAQVLLPLARHFDHIGKVLSTKTRQLQGRAVVALDLRGDDWLQIRLFFCEGEQPWQPQQELPSDQRIFELQATMQWQPLQLQAGASVGLPLERIPSDTTDSVPEIAAAVEPGASRLEEDVWLEAPDARTVDPAAEWLASTGADPVADIDPHNGPDAPETHLGWWVKTTPKRMAVFAECWEARPTSVQFFGTERVRRLLSGRQVVRPKLKIESSGLDWFAVRPEWEAEGLALSDADMAKLRSATTRFVKLASGWVRRDAVEAHDQAAALLADLGVEIGGGEQRVTLWQLAGAKAESIHALEQMGADPNAMRALTKLRKQLRQFSGVPEVPVPANITAELRPYQKRGLDFLMYASRLGIGCVLADDMGLGKTLQALAWLQSLVMENPKGGPSLVVCPTSVVHNWMREAEQFAPQLRVLALNRGEERHELRKEIDRYDLVITNYALLRRDVEQWKDVELRAIILDEAQNIKNPDAAVSRAACSLRAQHRLALTGTPLENRPLDLWSIVSFVNPGYLGNRTQFGMRFDRIDAPPHARALLAAKLRPMLLRRLKRDVATDLPERIEERRDCELTAGQRQLYLAELRRSRKLVDDLGDDPGALRKNKITILAALTRLRQICCHPALAKGKASLGSGKFEALFELLEPLLAEGHKVLLFSQFVTCLELLEKEMVQRDIAHHKLTGETVKREAVVRAFQEDPQACVFLISLKAGGTGLNLTAASYVVLFDPWWNPAVEAQAIDRTHRIGQDRTVIAYRMITSGTIEEKIWELQKKKSAMVQDILGEDGFARALGRDDLNFLLREV